MIKSGLEIMKAYKFYERLNIFMYFNTKFPFVLALIYRFACYHKHNGERSSGDCVDEISQRCGNSKSARCDSRASSKEGRELHV